jgi:hypothetical protein
MNCYTSIPKTLGLLLIGLALCGTSYFVISTAKGFMVGIGWFGLVFFGAATVAIGAQLLRRKPVVMIDHEGITVARGGHKRVTWRQVINVSIGTMSGQNFLCITLHDEDAYIERLPRWSRLLTKSNRSLGFPALTVSFNGLTPGIKEAYAYIETVFNDTRRPIPAHPHR